MPGTRPGMTPIFNRFHVRVLPRGLEAHRHQPAAVALDEDAETRAALPWNGWCSHSITIALSKPNSRAETSGAGAELALLRFCSASTALRSALVCRRAAPTTRNSSATCSAQNLGLVMHHGDFERLPRGKTIALVVVRGA